MQYVVIVKYAKCSNGVRAVLVVSGSSSETQPTVAAGRFEGQPASSKEEAREFAAAALMKDSFWRAAVDTAGVAKHKSRGKEFMENKRHTKSAH